MVFACSSTKGFQNNKHILALDCECPQYFSLTPGVTPFPESSARVESGVRTVLGTGGKSRLWLLYDLTNNSYTEKGCLIVLHGRQTGVLPHFGKQLIPLCSSGWWS
eukprot:5036826-Amphidinium_carterae.2